MRPSFTIPTVVAVAVVALVAGCASRRAPAPSTPEPVTPALEHANIPSGGVAATVDTPAADTGEWRTLRRRLAGFATATRPADSVAAVDFAALRSTYAASGDYDPYGSDAELRKAMFDALGRDDFAGARRLADSALAQNYLDLFAHVGANAAASGLGDSSRADFHVAVIRGLFEAIAATGDGTEAKPWVVLSVDEEYALLQAQGLERTQQSLSTCAGGRPCDILTVTERRGGATRTLYFDITLPHGWLTRRFEEKK